MYIQGIRQYRLLLLYHGQILLWDYALELSSGSRAMDKGSWKRYGSVNGRAKASIWSEKHVNHILY